MLVENISNDGDSNQKNGINERDSGLDSTIWWVGIVIMNNNEINKFIKIIL